MKEPKRLAHRQAERNKARALKHWDWDDDDASEPLFAVDGSQSAADSDDLAASTSAEPYHF
jgi:hypothetical protein